MCGLPANCLPFPIVGAVIAPLGVAAFCKVAVAEARKKTYEDFYGKCDSMTDFEDVTKASFFRFAR